MLPSHQWYGIVPGSLLFYALIAAAAVLFGRRALYLLRLLMKGKPMARWDRVPARVGRVIVYVFGQVRLLANDFWPGLMHATIFWGFVVLTLGTMEFFGKGVTESFSLPLLSDTAPYLILEDVFSVLVIVAVGYAMFRRLVTRPRRLNLSTEANVILLLILGLMVTDLVADAGRIVLAPAPSDHWQFAGQAIARVARVAARGRGHRDLPRRVVAARGHPARLPGPAALLQAPAHPGLPAQRVLLGARAEGAGPQRGPGELGDLRGRQPHRAGLEGPLRHLQLHRVRPLHLALPRQHERQGARPEVAHPAPAGAALRRSAGASRSDRCPGAADGAGGRRHPRQRALGLHHLPLVRGRLPGLHRARAEDRRHAPLAGAHRVALPGRAAARVPQPRDQRQPVADVVGDARGLGPRTWACGRCPTSTRRSTSTGSAATAPSTSATRRWPARWCGCCRRRASTSPSSATRRSAPASRPGAWATSTSTRPWPRATSRRSSGTSSRPS